MGVHSEDSLDPHPRCTSCSPVPSWQWLLPFPSKTLLRLLRPRLLSRLHSLPQRLENTHLSVLTPSIQSTMTYRLLRLLPPTWTILKMSLLPKLLSKLLSMTQLLEVWLPNRLPPLSMSFLLPLLLWLLLQSLPPIHMLLVSPSTVWDMLAFPTLVWDTMVWDTMDLDITVLASPTLVFLWLLLLLLLPRNEQLTIFFSSFRFTIIFIQSLLLNFH